MVSVNERCYSECSALQVLVEINPFLIESLIMNKKEIGSDQIKIDLKKFQLYSIL